VARLTPADRAAHKRATLQAIRRRWRRYDYYPNEEAAKAGTSITSAINELVEAGAAEVIDELPEFFRQYR